MRQMNNVNLEPQDRLISGIGLIYDAVKSTFGPNGNTAILKDSQGNIHITKDGITVAEYVHSDDPIEAIGIDLVRKAAREANEISGDGSTTTTILTAAMLKEGFYMGDRNSFYKECTEIVIPYLREQSTLLKLSSTTIVENIARLSSNGDAEITEILSYIFNSLGEEAHIEIEQITEGKTHIEVNPSFLIKNVQYSNAYFFNKNGILTSIGNKGSVFIFEDEIKELKTILERVGSREEEGVTNKGIPLIIAHKISNNIKALLEQNIKAGKLDIVILEFPMHRKYAKDLIEDLKYMDTRSVFYSYDPRTQRLEINANNTMDTHRRIESIKTAITPTTEPREIEEIEFRMANLSQKRAIIKLYCSNEVEYKERLDRLEDAINATRSSLKEGIVLGAGLELLMASNSLKISMPLKRALAYPHRLLMLSGVSPSVDEAKSQFIFDPLKTIITALEKASSLADVVLSSKVAIVQNI